MTNEAIVIVDRDAAFRLRLQFMLEAGGYDVVTAESASEAQQLLEETPVAVALIGLPLGDEDTRSLVSDLGSASTDPECILLTEQTCLPELVELYDLGNVYNHHWKPLEEVGDLARDIGRAIERRALKRQNAYLLTELRDARDELRSQAEFLVQVEKLASLGHVCSSVVSEMKWPMTRLKEAARLAGFDEMEGLARRLLHRVDGLSSFAELRPRTYERVNLSELVEEALDLLLPALTERGVHTAISSETSNITVEGERGLLQQVVVNLVLNSLQAMPDGGLLTARIEMQGGDPGCAGLIIEDTGEGIAPDVLPHVFEPFYTTRPLGQGTGLGLSIVRSAVREHEGEIAIHSAVGQGTTVSITLPLVAAAVSTARAGVSVE